MNIKGEKMNNKSTTFNNFVFVEGGTFEMGSNEFAENEQPVHKVIISDFYISKYLVTLDEWANSSSHGRRGNEPIIRVNWRQTLYFCNNKSIEDGLDPVYYAGFGPLDRPNAFSESAIISCDFSKSGYRLPTESEWEYAARGGNKSQGYIFSGSDNIKEVAEYNRNNNKSPMPVGGKKPNELGIYDMSGNVREWCNDIYDSYSVYTQIDPGLISGFADIKRVARGGSYCDSATACRVTYRIGISSNDTFNNTGFRLVRGSE